MALFKLSRRFKLWNKKVWKIMGLTWKQLKKLKNNHKTSLITQFSTHQFQLSFPVNELISWSFSPFESSHVDWSQSKHYFAASINSNWLMATHCNEQATKFARHFWEKTAKYFQNDFSFVLSYFSWSNINWIFSVNKRASCKQQPFYIFSKPSISKSIEKLLESTNGSEKVNFFKWKLLREKTVIRFMRWDGKTLLDV